jgi:translocation and assembly module TamB
VQLTEPWAPDDSLKGARRDSAAKVALARPWPEVRTTTEGLKRTRRWKNLNIDAPWVRIAYPDSVGQMIRLAHMSTDENDPPVHFRDLTGTVRIHGDSVWAALSHFDMPATTGKATARIWWGGDKPVQMDVRAEADSVSLSDFSWIYPNLPRTGGGRTQITVRNDPKNLAALDFALHDLDLRTTKSHLRGNMTLAIGWPVLVVKDVDVRLEPADFDLLRTFNGGTFPVDFQGAFTGRLWAAGGRVDQWRVDSADLTYLDRRNDGATSHLHLAGEVDLLYPARARFRGFDVTLDPLDLRTITTLFPSFPRLHGTISGSATLDSVWTDVRFHDADITHTDGDGPASRLTGTGRVTLTDRNTIFDVTLDAEPISFTTLARSYPSIFLRGTFEGPIRVKGSSDQLAVDSRLTGAAGVIVVNELIDYEPQGGVGATGTVLLNGVDARQLTQNQSVPSTQLYVTVQNDVHGDSLSTSAGVLNVAVDTSRVEQVYVPHGTARVTVSQGHLHVDSMSLLSTGVRMQGSGMLGVKAGARDTLRFTIEVDSLGGLRSLLLAPDSAAGALLKRARRDSLAGTLGISGLLAGSVADSFTASATFLGEKLVFGSTAAEHLAGEFEIAGLPHAPGGTIWARADSAHVVGAAFDTVHAVLTLAGADSGELSLRVVTVRPPNSVRGAAHLGYAFRGDTTRVTFDSLGVVTGEHTWRLARRAHLMHGPWGDVLDSLLLRARGGIRLVARANLPATGEGSASLVVDSFPLSDLGAITQAAAPVAGTLTGDLRVAGSRAAPTMQLTSRFRDAKYGTLTFPYFTFDAQYAEQTLVTHLLFFDRGQSVAALALTVPADFALQPVAQRFPDRPIAGRFTSDSVDLAAFASLSPELSEPMGRASADLTISGTLKNPLFSGGLRVHGAQVGLPRFGVRFTALEANVQLEAGGLRIDTLTMQSGAVPGNFIAVTGTMRVPDMLALMSDRRVDTLDLTMRAKSFLLVDSRRYARMEITDSIRLRGPFRAATLTGRVAIDKADFYISDLARRTDVIDLDDPELFPDSTELARRQATNVIPADVREAMRNLSVQDFSVSVGDKVWLRSQESEIKLGGAVAVRGSDSKQLEGRIDVQRGTYRLDFGLVQRTFQVDSGAVWFFGDANRAGSLNIWGSSVVRQASREGDDLTVYAHITGTTVAPKFEFSAGGHVALSQTEIFNYLIFGQGSPMDVSSASQYNPLTRALSASLGTVMESVLAGQLKLVDQISIQTGNPQQQSDAQSVAAGTRFGVGKQVGDKTYVSANVGLCWIQSSSASTSLAQSLGVSLEQQLGTRFYLMASMEPSSAALLCKPGTTDIGSHPRQYGLDLFREWSF